MTTTLPNKLSELLRLSVHDAQLCEKDPRYILDMEIWHSPGPYVPPICYVCMAGAVMAKTLETPMGSNSGPSCTEFKQHLESIDFMRMGAFGDAYERLFGHDALLNISEVHYTRLVHCQEFIEDVIDDSNESEHEFYAPWDVYVQCADMLEEVGL